MENRELAQWMARVQDYVDGTLSRTQALQFYLLTRREPRLKAELESYRQMIASLEDAPRSHPSDAFDAAIMASVPLEHYQNAPRAPQRVLVLGDDRPGLLERARRPVGRWMAATAVAYVLFLGVSHSFLSQWATQAALAIRGSLENLSAQVDSVPVLSSVVGFVARSFDAGIQAFSAMSTVVGSGVVTVLVGILTGVVALAIVNGRRRRPIDG